MTENHEFNEIYEKYKNSVLHAAYLYAKDSDMAEDIRQETFLKLLRLMECEEPAVNIESWLYITARNMALNYRKRMKAEMPLIQEDEAETPSSGLFRESTEDEYLEMQANRMRRIFMTVSCLHYGKRTSDGTRLFCLRPMWDFRIRKPPR